MKKLLILTSHPIQYQTPLWQRMAKAGVPMEVLFLCPHGVKETRDPEFDQSFAWDLPMLEEYRSRFLEIPGWDLKKPMRMRRAWAGRRVVAKSGGRGRAGAVPAPAGGRSGRRYQDARGRSHGDGETLGFWRSSRRIFSQWLKTWREGRLSPPNALSLSKTAAPVWAGAGKTARRTTEEKDSRSRSLATLNFSYASSSREMVFVAMHEIMHRVFEMSRVGRLVARLRPKVFGVGKIVEGNRYRRVYEFWKTGLKYFSWEFSRSSLVA